MSYNFPDNPIGDFFQTGHDSIVTTGKVVDKIIKKAPEIVDNSLNVFDNLTKFLANPSMLFLGIGGILLFLTLMK